MTDDICPVPRWCDERARHELPHRHYLGELKVTPPQRPHFVTVGVIGVDQMVVGVELTVATAREPYAVILLDWPQVDELAGLLLAARKRYAA